MQVPHWGRAWTNSPRTKWRKKKGIVKIPCFVVPEVGLEPTRPLRTPDFESGASANSATLAGTWFAKNPRFYESRRRATMRDTAGFEAGREHTTMA